MARMLCRRSRASLAVTAAALAVAGLPAAAGAKVYFSAFPAEGGTAIERAAFDGSRRETVQIEPAGFEDGVALDMAAGHVFWTDTSASVIGRANLNGGESEIVFDDLGWEPLGVALDTAQGKLYWNDKQGIKRANLDGSAEELLVKGPTTGMIALDTAAQRMYWAVGGSIRSAPMEPSPPVEEVVTGQSEPFGIAVDHAGGKLYWLELKHEKIRRSNLDGSEVETIVERPGAGFEGGLAVDPSAGRLYWTEAGAHDIATSNLDGSEARALFATAQDSPIGLAVESSEPHPQSIAPPAIEGAALTGSAVVCSPGSWSGIGTVFLSYRWLLDGATLEGVSGSVYVPSADEAGGALACQVTATDNVETTTAQSAGVSVAAPAVASTPAPSAPAPTRLVAGIAAARMTSTARRARIPVFTTVACTATLTAVPLAPARRKRSHGGRSTRSHRRVLTRGRLQPGRATMTLGGLQPGVNYRLVFTATSAEGQTVRDTATLRVSGR